MTIGALPCFDDQPAHVRHDEEDDAGFGCLKTARGALPLAAFAADLTVTGMHYAWRLRQTFVNANREPIEAVYIFPLPPRAAVSRFRMTVAGRVVEGRLKERGEARADYQQAVEQGRRAALLEEDRPNVFTVQVGNLQAGEHAEVDLEISGPVAVEDEHASVRLPLVVAARYIPGQALGDDVGSGTAADTDQVPDASRITPPVLLPGFPNPVRLEITLALDSAGLPVEGLSCSLPTAAVDGAAGHWRVVPGQRLDRDLILRWRPATTTLVGNALAVAVSGGGEALAITVAPPRSTAGAKPRDMVILLDRSGSMKGWKMVAARRAAARMVDMLDGKDRLAVLAFDDGIIAPPGHERAMVPASDRARFAAIGFLAGIAAAGGTEIDPALQAAFTLLDQGDAGRERVLVLITDGQVGNEDQLLKKYAAGLAHTRVIALGIDKAVNEALMERLAKPGRGWSACVESEDWLDQILAIAARQIQPPALTDVTVEGPGIVAGSLTPEPLPDAYPTRPLTVWVRMNGDPATVTLRGILPDGAVWRQELPVQRRAAPVVAHCWARSRIRDLEDRHVANPSDGSIPGLITALSLEQNVLSRFTAFVAIDQVITEYGPGRTMVQAVDVPAGWGVAEALAQAPAPAAAMPAPAQDAEAFMLDASFSRFCMRRGSAVGLIGSSAAPGPAAGGAGAPPPSALGKSRRIAGRPKQPAAKVTRGAMPGALSAADIVAQTAAVHTRLKAIAADQLHLALSLRKQEILDALRAVQTALAGDGHQLTGAAAKEAGELERSLQALLQRVAPPATIREVSALWPELTRILDAIVALLGGGTGVQGAAAKRSKRRFWG